MSFFGRRSTAPPTAATPAPIAVVPTDLERASQLLKAFLDAMGSDPQLRYAALQVSQAGGAPSSLEDAIRRGAAGEDPGWDRPWHWLLAVARQAASEHRMHLLAEIALFITFWNTALAPNLTIADQTDMMLGKVPSAVLTEIQALARSNLGLIDSGTVVSENRTGTITMGYLLDVLCAS